MTALIDGTPGGNWDAARSAVIDYTADDAATADLVAGFINLGEILIKHIALKEGQSDEAAVQVLADVVARMGEY